MNIAFTLRPVHLSVYPATWPNANFFFPLPSTPLLWLPTGNIQLNYKSRVGGIGGDLHLEFKKKETNTLAVLIPVFPPFET